MSNASPASYIHMVQHMIETCLMYKMSKEECIEAISKNANINPIITSTVNDIKLVWEELVKENKEFFENYEQNNNILKMSQYKSEEDPMSEIELMSKVESMSEGEPVSEVEPMSDGETNQMIENITFRFTGRLKL